MSLSATNRKLRVFLCHASQDKPIVRELYQRLLAEGWIDPWLDEEKLLPGQDWDMEIEKAVENADAVIVCLSNNSVNKAGYVQKEILKILDVSKEKPEGAIFLIPIRFENCQPPHRLKGWQYVDYFPAEDESRAHLKILASLKICGNVVGLNYYRPQVGFHPVGTIVRGADSNSRKMIDEEVLTTNKMRRSSVSEMNSDEIIFGGRMPKANKTQLLEQQLKEFYKWFSFGRYGEDEKIYYITSSSGVELINKAIIPLMIIIFSMIGILTVLLGKVFTWSILLWVIFGYIGIFALQSAFKSWKDVFYILTNYRIFSTKRFGSGKIGVNQTIEILDLLSIAVETTLIDRLLNTGSVTFRTRLSTLFEISSVDDPKTISWIMEGLWAKSKKTLARNWKPTTK